MIFSHLILFFLHTSVSLTSCISNVFFSFEYFYSCDHYAACWVTLKRFRDIICYLLLSLHVLLLWVDYSVFPLHTAPTPPTFDFIGDVGETYVDISWVPSRSANPGSVFYVQYRARGQSQYSHGPFFLIESSSYMNKIIL